MNTMLFWGSGIFFDLSTLTGKAVLIKYINPLAGILMNGRAILVYGNPLDMNLLAINLLTAVIFLLFGLWIFKKFSAKALEKI
jgi:ABC-type polysaccharide/polyol phosphate export permease